ncbi:MAG: FAD-binding protein [Paludibacter sp.]|nr:MAG: FAD-binding protein [Paludibacter sp.]
MNSELQLIVSPKESEKRELLLLIIAQKLSINKNRITGYRILRKSIDSRSKKVKVNLLLSVYWDEPIPPFSISIPEYQNVSKNKSVIIVGSGPAGLFTALELIKLGIKPIILERGKDVRERRKDIVALNKNLSFDTNSNYCFGEGGAGTFSDGKLYTRSKKKGHVKSVLETFYLHGAKENILYESHPHIGSDRLPKIISNIRKTIIKYGGKILFNKRVNSLIKEQNRVVGCTTSDGIEYRSKAVILATGHSARDIYKMLYDQGIELEIKGFAMGVRVEHPQKLIDSIQYHTNKKSEYLPSATYSLVTQVDKRGVYSFCMCPGGYIVPAGSDSNEIVVNGMSASKRNSPYANSGIVVEIRPEDIPQEFQKYGALAGLKYQEHLETLAITNNGGKGFTAPAQRLVDFVNNRLSDTLPQCSYYPGLISSPLHFWLPNNIREKLQKAFILFNNKMKGYLTNEAVVVGVETRSSSPIRIPRNRETFQHINTKGLFLVGEGAGYAGGITSSAVDGINCAIKVAKIIKNNENG